MRNELIKYKNQTKTFTAIYDGKIKTMRDKNYYLVRNLRLDNSYDALTDHIWLQFDEKPNIKNGEIIKFTAIISSYIKGYWGKHGRAKFGFEKDIGLDYELKDVQNLHVIYTPEYVKGVKV